MWRSCKCQKRKLLGVNFNHIIHKIISRKVNLYITSIGNARSHSKYMISFLITIILKKNWRAPASLVMHRAGNVIETLIADI